MSEANTPQLLTKDAVCSRLHVSPRCLENMVRGDLFPPPVRIGKTVYWSEVALEKWLATAFARQEEWSPRAGRRGR